jgi:radical SAM protein with 4Fe4S-binding SPASM domain
LALSRYLHAVATGDGRVIAYSNVAFEPVVMTVKDWRRMHAGDGISIELYGRLAQAGLIADAEADDRLIAHARRQVQASVESTQVLYLIASDGCTMACSYCPVPVRRNLDALMPVTVFQRNFTELVQSANNKVAQRFILLYGGEPLENLPLLEHIADTYTELHSADSAALEILVCSNLTALDDRVIEVLGRAPFKVVAGIDAPAPGRGHQSRVLSDATGNYEQTIEASMRLIAKGIPTYASTTLTPHTAERMSHFLRALQVYGFQGAGVNLLRGARGKQMIERAGITIEQYTDLAADCFNRIAGDASLGDFEYNTLARYGRLMSKISLDLDCHAYGNQVVVYPDGTKGSCYLRGDRAHTPGVQNLARLPLFNPGCDGCAARPICGGGCPWSTEELTGSPGDIDPIACQVTRAVNATIVRRAALT